MKKLTGQCTVFTMAPGIQIYVTSYCNFLSCLRYNGANGVITKVDIY